MSTDNVTPTDLKPGQIEFYDACYPPLQSGDYRLVVSQQLGNVKVDPNQGQPSFSRSEDLTLTSPRFTLDASTVQMVYPPANSQGPFTEAMPNVVLTRRTLPWERPIDPAQIGEAGSPVVNASQDHTPWVAVIMIKEEELGAIKPRQMAVEQLLSTGDSKIKGPQLNNLVSDAEKQTLCLGIDIPVNLFRAIAPKVEELKYLNHVRQVNTDGKEVLGIDEQGWYSVTVGNRMALKGGQYHCYLVSLEGHKDDLPGGTDLSGIDSLRFALLANWSFTADPSPGDFIGLLQAIPKRGGNQLMQMPNRSKQDGNVPTEVNKILDIGYTTLQLSMNNGEQTNCWYRGPMVAAPTVRETSINYTNADQAIRYDQKSGLFDMSYAAAWQIGRLLALSDATYAKQYYNWRIANYNAMDAQTETRVVAAKIAPSITMDAEASPRVAAEQAGVSLLAHALAKSDINAPKVKSKHQARCCSTLPGVVNEDTMNKHIATGLPPLVAVKPKVADLTE
jgi:hypothetical protein